MNAKTVFSTALVWTALGLGTVRAQTPGAMQAADVTPPTGAVSSVEGVPAPVMGQQGHLSAWIRGDKYGCCGEVGENGPIETELFFRIGPSIPLGNGTVADVLQTGLYMGGGARVLFFDPEVKDAWTLELGAANIDNHAHLPSYAGIPLNIFVPNGAATPTNPLPPVPVSFGQNGVPGVTLRDLNRTYFDLGGGREWYLWGSGCSGGINLRWGCDVGGRWGSEMAEFNEIPHRTDTIAGFWTAVHCDFEFPLSCCCVFQAGLRIEYGYTWSDIMQIQNKSDVQDLNILFNVGVRY